MLRRAGLAPRGRSSDTLDGGLVAPGTLAVTDALDALDALALPVGPIVDAAGLQRAAEVWEIVRPDVLIVDPASLAFLRGADGYPRPRLFVAHPDAGRRAPCSRRRRGGRDAHPVGPARRHLDRRRVPVAPRPTISPTTCTPRSSTAAWC